MGNQTRLFMKTPTFIGLALASLILSQASAQVQIPQARNCPYTNQPSQVAMVLQGHAEFQADVAINNPLIHWVGESGAFDRAGQGGGMHLLFGGMKRSQLELGVDYALYNLDVISSSVEGQFSDRFQQRQHAFHLPIRWNVAVGQSKLHTLVSMGASYNIIQTQDGLWERTDMDDSAVLESLPIAGSLSTFWTPEVAIGLGSQINRSTTLRLQPALRFQLQEDDFTPVNGVMSVAASVVKHL